MEEPRDTTLFDGHDHDLVRVEAALSALREEAVHDHGVPWLSAMSKLSSRNGRHVPAVSSSICRRSAAMPSGPRCAPERAVSSRMIHAASGGTNLPRARRSA